MRTLCKIDELHAMNSVDTKFMFVFCKLTLKFMPSTSNNSIIETLKRVQNYKRTFGELIVLILHRHLL